MNTEYATLDYLHPGGILARSGTWSLPLLALDIPRVHRVRFIKRLTLKWILTPPIAK